VQRRTLAPDPEILQVKSALSGLLSLQCSRPYLESVLPRPAAKAAATALLSKCDHTEHSDESSDDDEGVDLCNCEFSLAYGEIRVPACPL